MDRALGSYTGGGGCCFFRLFSSVFVDFTLSAPLGKRTVAIHTGCDTRPAIAYICLVGIFGIYWS